MFIEVWFPHQDLLTEFEEEKNNQTQYQKEKQGIGFKVKNQQGITLQILNEIMCFTGKFVYKLEYK